MATDSQRHYDLSVGSVYLVAECHIFFPCVWWDHVPQNTLDASTPSLPSIHEVKLKKKERYQYVSAPFSNLGCMCGGCFDAIPPNTATKGTINKGTVQVDEHTK